MSQSPNAEKIMLVYAVVLVALVILTITMRFLGS